MGPFLRLKGHIRMNADIASVQDLGEKERIADMDKVKHNTH